MHRRKEGVGGRGKGEGRGRRKGEERGVGGRGEEGRQGKAFLVFKLKKSHRLEQLVPNKQLITMYVEGEGTGKKGEGRERE